MRDERMNKGDQMARDIADRVEHMTQGLGT